MSGRATAAKHLMVFASCLAPLAKFAVELKNLMLLISVGSTDIALAQVLVGMDWNVRLDTSCVNVPAARNCVDTYQVERRMLQCVAVCCSVLQCVAVCCGVLHCVAVCCSVIQRWDTSCVNVTAARNCVVTFQVERSVLQCVAVCCDVVQCVAVYCSVLQCVAVCCSVLRCVAVCCSVLQCDTALGYELHQCARGAQLCGHVSGRM